MGSRTSFNPLAMTAAGVNRRFPPLSNRTYGWKPICLFGGAGGVGGGLRICITSCRTCTIAVLCTSNRAVSFFSKAASFRASSGAARRVSRIITKARMTKTLI